MTDSQSKYGRQPFADLLIEEGRTISKTGQALGFDGGYTLRVGCGRARPSEDFKQAISRLLRRPVRELFTDDALEQRYVARSNAVGLRRESER